jgi:hypothetical protein
MLLRQDLLLLVLSHLLPVLRQRVVVVDARVGHAMFAVAEAAHLDTVEHNIYCIV